MTQCGGSTRVAGNGELGVDVRVMTWNIRAASGGDDARINEGALERIIDVMRDSDADVIGLQEVDRFWMRSGGVDQPLEIASQLGFDHAFVPNWLPEGGDANGEFPQYGVVLLSRWPIARCEHVVFDSPEGWEPRGALIARVNLPGSRGDMATFVVTHLQVDPEGQPDAAAEQRSKGIDCILGGLDSAYPAVVMGDFNAVPDAAELQMLRTCGNRGWSDAWSVACQEEDGFTIPALRLSDPTRRIDYVWVDQRWRVRNAQVIVNDATRVASDHYPVVAELHIDSETR